MFYLNLKKDNFFQNCESEFGGKNLNELNISFVRNVAPHKDMMRASFPLTLDLLTANVKKPDLLTANTKKVDQDQETAQEPEIKKQKMSQ